MKASTLFLLVSLLSNCQSNNNNAFIPNQDLIDSNLLLEFTATLNQNHVLLEWKSAFQQRKEGGFEVQKSIDKVTWKKSKWIKVYEPSIKTNGYTAIDKSLTLGWNHYRILQKDETNKVIAQSNIQSIEYLKRPKLEITQIKNTKTVLIKGVSNIESVIISDADAQVVGVFDVVDNKVDLAILKAGSYYVFIADLTPVILIFED